MADTFDDERTRATHGGANEALGIGKTGAVRDVQSDPATKVTIELALPPGNPNPVSWMPRFPACQICAARLPATSAVGRREAMTEVARNHVIL